MNTTSPHNDAALALEQSYEDYLSDEPGQYGIPDGLSRDEYREYVKAALPQ